MSFIKLCKITLVFPSKYVQSMKRNTCQKASAGVLPTLGADTVAQCCSIWPESTLYALRPDCPGPQMGTSVDRGSWPPFLACRHPGRSHLPAPEPKKHCHHYSVDQSYPTLSHARDCSAPGFPVQHHLPEFAQTHIHGVGVQETCCV